ncbi:MAG: hypothetical protein B6240_02060 [Desulfobacteraceae bacterium 4572_87]|nr:MAG: hypothetical protein B6240_02060 [Desulfobacteraceae bacterium 4572_87]
MKTDYDSFSIKTMLFQSIVTREIRIIITGRRNPGNPISTIVATGCERWHKIRFFHFGNIGNVI